MKKRLSHDEFKGFPKEFRGCMWNDGWEFDAPSVIYYPKKYARYGDGGNSSVLDRLIEDIACDLEDGKKPSDGGLAHECAWRGWGKRFNRRKDAWHVVFKIRWFRDKDGYLSYEVKSRKEVWGLPNTSRRITARKDETK